MWWNKRKGETQEIERRIADNDQAITETRRERDTAAALTPVIREDSTRLVKRGTTNRFGESLMLAWELKNAHGNG